MKMPYLLFCLLSLFSTAFCAELDARSPLPALQTFSISASRLPVHDLLFALGRDAKIDIDIHPDVAGSVTLNAIRQTVPQIMARLARQLDIRWRFDQGVLIVEPDTAYVERYTVDYFNLSRAVKSHIAVANTMTEVGSTRTGVVAGNSSTTSIEIDQQNQFWKRLDTNLRELLASVKPVAADASAAGDFRQVILNPETGTVLVRANSRDQRRVAEFLAGVQAAARRQVLIEATVVEVALSDQFQAGIDWSRLASGSGWSLSQQMLGGNLATAPFGLMQYTSESFTATVKMLETFGTARVLSSPRVIALNNQTALMKVVEEQVYFTLEVKDEDKTLNGSAVSKTTYNSTLHTVPVGLMLQLTPQIAETGRVALNVRPTITNVSAYVDDPAFALWSAGKDVAVRNSVPMLQVREFDSTLQIASGQIAVLGGLIQEVQSKNRSGIPGLSTLSWIGDFFSFRDERTRKIELVIFLRPIQVAESRA
jgi:general secretion pathway protein D